MIDLDDDKSSEVEVPSTTPKVTEQELFDPWEEEFRKTLQNGDKAFDF